MADSDEEYTNDKRKTRDKFERERADCDERVWSDLQQAQHAGWSKGRVPNRNDNRYLGPGAGYMNRRLPDNRERSPNKKFKTDSDDRVSCYSTYVHLDQSQYHSPKANHDNHQRIMYNNKANCKTQCSVDETTPMSFKQFLETLDDGIDEAEALKKYVEYKSDLFQTKIEKFFDVHRDEEWFRLKYHPDEKQRRLLQHTVHLKSRLKLFNELFNSEYLDKISLDINRSDELVYLIDAIILKLEGESEEPLEALLNVPHNVEDVKNGYTSGKEVETDPSGTRTNCKKYCSIALANLPIDTTKANLLEKLSNLPGFLRVSLTDPYYVEGGHLRRKAFATFKTYKDVMDVYWTLETTGFGNCKIEATINKEISKRIRHVDGITSHKSIVLNDLTNAATIILNLDNSKNIWNLEALEDDNKDDPIDMDTSDQADKNTDQEEDSFKKETVETSVRTEKTTHTENFESEGVTLSLQQRINKTKNPLLHNIGMYLVEEASAEEEELLGFGGLMDDEQFEDLSHETLGTCRETKQRVNDSESFEKSEEHLRVLDKLLLYLRIVHSFDYYSHTEYSFEDDMPNRLGILHVRGMWPAEDEQNSSKTSDGQLMVKKDAIKNYIDDFNAKIKSYTVGRSSEDLTEDQRLIVRDSHKEMNSDLETWSVIKKDKEGETSSVYKCKHCKKRFEKNLDFLIKHVERKHPQVPAVFKADVEFFNNYLFDPHRLDPNPPKELLEKPSIELKDSALEDVKNPMAMSREAKDKLKSRLGTFVTEPAPRGHSNM